MTTAPRTETRSRLEALYWLLPLLVLLGALFGLRAAFPPPGEEPDARAEEEIAWEMGTRTPEHWGLPVLPGAEDFRSMEGPPNRGSATYRLRAGSLEAAVDFYRRALAADGWELLADAAHAYRMPEENRGPTGDSTAPGHRLILGQEETDRLLIANFLENPYAGAAVEINLGIQPLSGSPFGG